MAFDSNSIADNTTVVGGPSSAVNRKDLIRDRIDESDISSTYPKKAIHLQDFSKNTDYALQDRPFFAPINPKDGVIGALQRIDTQLRNVSTAMSVSFQALISPVWTQGSPIS